MRRLWLCALWLRVCGSYRIYDELYASLELTCDATQPVLSYSMGCTYYIRQVQITPSMWDPNNCNVGAKYCDLPTTMKNRYAKASGNPFMDGYDQARLWQVEIRGVTLTELLPADPYDWDDQYWWLPLGLINGGCKSGDTLCRKAMACTVTQRYWAEGIEAEALGGSPDVKDQIGPDFTHQCTFCPPSPCQGGDATCGPGTVIMPTPPITVSKALSPAGYPYAYTRAQCTKQCSPGYWLTCTADSYLDKCSYTPPSGDITGVVLAPGSSAQEKQSAISKWIRYNMQQNGGRSAVPMLLPWGLPLGECYPCGLAGGISHYGEAPLPSYWVDNTDGQWYVSFFCPGGDLPPTPCPDQQQSRVDRATMQTTTCQCINGRYLLNGACVLCPAGFYCAFGQGIQRCPDNTYATGGAWQCAPCRQDTSICADFQALTQCLAGHQERDAECIDCNNCLMTPDGGEARARPCLRVANISA